jgi:hypothetical protein
MKAAAAALLFLIACTTSSSQEKPTIDREACRPFWEQVAKDGANEIWISEGVARSRLIIGGRSVIARTGGDALITGNVTVLFEIDKSGNARYATACKGPILLRSAAISAVAKWKFRPYLLNGRAVAVTASAVVPVTLQPPGDH